jgi:hypothetical protein
MMHVRALPVICGLAWALGACSSDSSTGLGGGGTCASGSLASFDRTLATTSAAGPRASAAVLSPLQGSTVAAQDLPTAVSLPADGGTYLVVPQFADTGTGAHVPTSFEVATQGIAASAAAPRFLAHGSPRSEPVQMRLDRTLRQIERELAPRAAGRARASVRRSRAVAAAPALGSTCNFEVLSDLSGNSFTTVTATLKYVGTSILIYVDQQAPTGANGFTDAQLNAFGDLFDRTLYGIDVQAFGSPSDVDQNGRVIVLLTPGVNRLTPAGDCSSFVAGFFYGLDLIDAQHSNRGEIFYSLVPDPAGTFGCPQSLPVLDRVTPPTFLHEFQHMISFGQHVLVRGGAAEATWLDEGMSHMAEELGARYYEQRYPPPSGRTNPASLFPDSAVAFISGDLVNSYSYLLDTPDSSVTLSNGQSIAERGAAWLFLRWLADQKDSTILGRIVQSNLTGIANVEAQSGETFLALFGDFSLALYTDSLPGVARSQIPTRYRFISRNLRQLYAALHAGRPDLAPLTFPIVLTRIGVPGGVSAAMVPGTMSFFLVQMPGSGPSESLRFTGSGGAALNATLGAQATVFRCPSAAACPLQTP